MTPKKPWVRGRGREDLQDGQVPAGRRGGQITAVCGISIDITAQKEAIELRDELAAAQQQAIDELRLSRQETVERLAKAIELHDSSTGEHVDRMATIAAFLGTQLELDPDRVELLRAAAPMHDVGKIGTPERDPPQARAPDAPRSARRWSATR